MEPPFQNLLAGDVHHSLEVIGDNDSLHLAGRDAFGNLHLRLHVLDRFDEG